MHAILTGFFFAVLIALQSDCQHVDIDKRQPLIKADHVTVFLAESDDLDDDGRNLDILTVIDEANSIELSLPPDQDRRINRHHDSFLGKPPGFALHAVLRI